MSADTYARFYVHPQLQGDGKYKDKVYVEIFIKGNKNTSFGREMRESDKQTYPNGWSSFKDSSIELSDGTPIKILPGLSPSQSIEMKDTGITTIEDLAELSDSQVVGNQGMVTLRKRAIAYLAAMSIEFTEDEITESPVDIKELESDRDVIPADGNEGLASILDATAPQITGVLHEIGEDDLFTLIEAEEKGKNRKGIVKAITEEINKRAA